MPIIVLTPIGGFRRKTFRKNLSIRASTPLGLQKKTENVDYSIGSFGA